MTTRRRCAFTMIEVLLVTAIFASLGLAAFTCLSNGLKMWSRSQKLTAQEDVAILLDRMSLELRNSFLFSRIPFQGEELRFSFPTVVTTAADRAGSRAHEGYVEQIGSVRYSFDPGAGRILREQANYSQATHGDFGPARVEAHGVKEMRLRYYYSDSADPRMSTSGKDRIPSGVSIEIHVMENGEDRVFQRYMPVPVGV